MAECHNSITVNNRGMFILLIIYLVFDYARPQAIIPIGFLRPLMVIIIVLSIMTVMSGGLALIKCKQTLLIWLFIALLASYVPFARNNFFAYQTTESMLLYMPFILSTIISVQSIERLKIIINTYLILMIYISLYSLSHGGMGPGNYFADENDLSLYINVWIPFCYFLLFAENNVKIRFIYIVGLLIGLVAIIASFSRGGFVGLVAISLTVWLLSRNKIRTIMIVAIIGFFVLIMGDQTYWNEMSTITDTREGTATARIESWKSAWNMFLDNPLGVGGNNFQVWFPEYQTEYFRRGMWGRVAHSIWFTLIPELGVLGILIYGLLLNYNIRDVIFLQRINNKLKMPVKDAQYLSHLGYAYMASMAGYFASGTFLSVLYYPHYWYMTAIIISSVHIAKKTIEDTPKYPVE